MYWVFLIFEKTVMKTTMLLKKINVIISLLICTHTVCAQCNIQINNRADGTVIKYLRAEHIASNEKLEVGLSLQTNGANYYLGTVIRYLSTAYAPTGDLTISTELNQTRVLKLYSSQKTYINGSEVYIAAYQLSKQDIKKLTVSNLKYITFETSDKVLNALKASKNKDVVINQYKCLTSNK
jgi:hypothetical protein